MFDLCWTKSHWDRLFSQYFRFTLSVSFHQCFTLIFIYTLLLPDEQTSEVWKPSKKKFFFGNQKHWTEKTSTFLPLTLSVRCLRSTNLQCRVSNGADAVQMIATQFTVSCIKRSRRRPNDCYPIIHCLRNQFQQLRR